MTPPIPIEEVIDAAKGAAALARELHISTSAVSQWRRVPAERALEVERITGISRHRLRPDIFGERDEVAA